MAPALCSRVCIMLEENEKMKNRMEKKLHHHGTALTLYDELGNGAVVYCFQSESDSAMFVLLHTANHRSYLYS